MTPPSPPHPPQRTLTASLSDTLYLRVAFSTEAPLSSLPSLTPAAATAALASSLARLAGESVPPTAWACVGVDPTARHAVYRVDARHEPTLRAALASLTSLGGGTPASTTATVVATAPFLLGVATDHGSLDAGALLAKE